MSAPPSTRRPPPRGHRPPMDARLRARRRAIQQAEQRRRRRVGVSLAVLVLLVAGGMALATSPLFAVSDVVVEGAGGHDPQDVRQAAGIVPGANLLRVDRRAAAAAVVDALPWVREAKVRREPPTTLVIEVVPRVPVAVVRVADRAWLIDGDGVIVSGGGQDGLVTVDAPNSVLPPVGEKVHDAAVRNALDVHLGLPQDLRARVDRYDAASPGGLRLHLGDGEPPGLWVRVGIAERVEAKAEAITLLLEHVRRQAERVPADASPPTIAEIDVRAPDNPVLVPASSPDDES